MCDGVGGVSPKPLRLGLSQELGATEDLSGVGTKLRKRDGVNFLGAEPLQNCKQTIKPVI